MYTLLDEQIFCKVWKNSDGFKILNSHEFLLDNLKVSRFELKTYFKNKKILRFAFVLPKENFDESMFEDEFNKLCNKFGISSSSYHVVDTLPDCISYTRYPKI